MVCIKCGKVIITDSWQEDGDMTVCDKCIKPKKGEDKN